MKRFVLTTAAAASISFGASAAVVTYDPNAPVGNFQAAGPSSNAVAYQTSLTADATGLTGVVTARPDLGGAIVFLAANVYLGTGLSANQGSDLGFEINATSVDAFAPGVSGKFDLTGTGFTSSVTATSVTFFIPIAFLENDPLGIGFDTLSGNNNDVVFRLSQSFGYSVAGGKSFGPDRLGRATLPAAVPEPASLALLGVTLLGLGAIRRRA